jgi:hypothetical protein
MAHPSRKRRQRFVAARTRRRSNHATFPGLFDAVGRGGRGHAVWLQDDHVQLDAERHAVAVGRVVLVVAFVAVLVRGQRWIRPAVPVLPERQFRLVEPLEPVGFSLFGRVVGRRQPGLARVATGLARVATGLGGVATGLGRIPARFRGGLAWIERGSGRIAVRRRGEWHSAASGVADAAQPESAVHVRPVRAERQQWQPVRSVGAQRQQWQLVRQFLRRHSQHEPGIEQRFGRQLWRPAGHQRIAGDTRAARYAGCRTGHAGHPGYTGRSGFDRRVRHAGWTEREPVAHRGRVSRTAGNERPGGRQHGRRTARQRHAGPGGHRCTGPRAHGRRVGRRNRRWNQWRAGRWNQRRCDRGRERFHERCGHRRCRRQRPDDAR